MSVSVIFRIRQIKYLCRRICAPQPGPFRWNKKNLRKSAWSALSKRVLRLTAEFVPDLANFNTGKLPLASPNREVRHRSLSQRGTGRWNAEKYWDSSIQLIYECADLSARKWRENLRKFVTKGLSNRGRSPASSRACKVTMSVDQTMRLDRYMWIDVYGA